MDRRATQLRTFAAMLAVMGLAAAVQAQTDGALDPSFWLDGKVTLAAPLYWELDATVVAPDGRLVVVGRRYVAGSQDILFWAILDDASLGTPCVPIAPGGGSFLRVQAAAFDAQGRLLIAGQGSFPSAGAEGFAMRFLYPACDPDETFNLDGIYRTDLVDAAIRGLAIDSSNRIVLAGIAQDAGGDDKLLVVRLSHQGLVDWDFANFGIFELDLFEPLSGEAVAVQADGRIVVGATRSPDSLTLADFFLVRLDLAGDLDSTFAAGGTVQIDLQADHYDFLTSLAIDPVSGDILAAGLSGTSAGFQFAAVRLASDGVLDDTFDGDGIWTDSLLDSDGAQSIQLQSDGKILVAGTVFDPDSSVADFAVFRLLPNGDPDDSFGLLGISRVSFDLDPIEHDQVHATSLDAGKLVVVGSAQDYDGGGFPRAVAARLWSDLIFTDGFERASSGAWSSAASAP